MSAYMKLRSQNEIYDPWIRTHLKSGAEVIKICNNSMNIQGDIKFWETLSKTKITKTGNYLVEGGLSPVRIDLQANHGEYREPNIWIYHS